MSTKKSKKPKVAAKTAHRRGAKKEPAKGRRFTSAEKVHALTLVVAGMTRVQVAATVGTTTESLRRWVAEAEASGTMPRPPGGASKTTAVDASDAGEAEPKSSTEAKRSVYAPKDPGQGLSAQEEAAILEYKRRHPSMGPAQIRAQLKRFKRWRLSIKAIARVLRAHGYEPVRAHGRPVGPQPVRFEAPHRNALWQADFTELRVGGERQQLLVLLDDFSRFCVGYRLCDSPSAEATIEAMQEAVARHGKPEAVRTDRGGGFLSKELGAYLEAELIDHVVGRAYHPEGGGKVESLVGTVKRELWEVEHFDDWQTATGRLERFIADYNERRAHMGIDGLTPADRFFGRADRVLAHIDAVSRRRHGAMAMRAVDGSPIEELGEHALEVLRLVVIDGRMELRFCGSRVILGSVTP
jgi:transposase InsO family protein